MAVSPRFRVPVLLAAVVAASGAGLVAMPGAASASVSASAALSASVSGPPEVDVASYVIADYDTGQILAEQDPPARSTRPALSRS